MEEWEELARMAGGPKKELVRQMTQVKDAARKRLGELVWPAEGPRHGFVWSCGRGKEAPLCIGKVRCASAARC